MSDHELDRFAATSDDPAAAEWLHSCADQFGRASAALLAMGYAVRVSCVGYGRALRLAVTDGRGWSTGWTLGSHGEVQGVCAGLLAPGAHEYIERRLEKPQRRR